MWRPLSPGFHGIADAFYDIDSPTERWLEHALAVVMRHFPGVRDGVGGLVEVERDGLRATAMVATSPEVATASVFHGSHQSPRYMTLRAKNPAATDRQIMGARFDSLPHASWLSAGGYADALVLYALEPRGNAAILGALLPERTDAWPERLVEEWEAVALHFVTAASLRAAIAEQRVRREAVLSEDGTLLHAEGRAIVGREALCDAVRRIHRSRGTWRDKPEELDARTPSVDARWTLVDQFESDGRHFVVAHVVEQDLRERELSPRERRVAEHVAAGWPLKRIAYRLGLSQGTVASYAHRAAEKLGVRGRVALAHALRRSKARG